jgi:NADH:ubiquinone oxidoreductase subunit C
MAVYIYKNTHYKIQSYLEWDKKTLSRAQMIYHFYSSSNRFMLTAFHRNLHRFARSLALLSVKAPKFEGLSKQFPAVVWLERELNEMFGILFTSHKDFRRLLTDYSFPSFPLRKNYVLNIIWNPVFSQGANAIIRNTSYNMASTVEELGKLREFQVKESNSQEKVKCNSLPNIQDDLKENEIVKGMLNSAQEIKKQIRDYILKKEITGIDKKDVDYSKQFYTMEDKVYYLNTFQKDAIYGIITTPHKSDYSKKLLEQSSIHITGIYDIISKILESLEAEINHINIEKLDNHKRLGFLGKIFEKLEKKSMVKAIIKVCEFHLYRKHLVKHRQEQHDNDNEETDLLYFNFCLDIGRSLALMYWQETFYKLRYEFIRIPLIRPVTKKFIISSITNQIRKAKYLPLTKLLNEHSSKDSNMFVLKLSTILMNKARNIGDDVHKSNLKIKISLQDDLERYYTNLGILIVESLISTESEKKIFTKTLKRFKREGNEHIKIKTPYILDYEEGLETELNLSAAYYKPPLARSQVTAFIKDPTLGVVEIDSIKIDLKVSADLVDDSKNLYHTKLTPKMRQILKDSLQHYCIDKDFFDAFLIDFERTLTNSASSEETQVWIDAIYGINFSNVLRDITGGELRNNLLKRLCEYAMNFTIYVERKDDKLSLIYAIKTYANMKSLPEDITVQTVLTSLYSKITSIKMYFIGLLNELEIYKDFNYFLIPKTVSYTGRIFDLLYYLSLQRHKIVHGFVLLRVSKKAEVTKDNFNQVKETFSNILHNRAIKEELDQVTYSMYTDDLINKKSAYILSFCKDNDTSVKEIKAFIECAKTTEILNINDTLAFLSKHIKKTKNIVKVTNLLFNYIKTNPNVGHVYEVDATNSVYQVIAMLFNDKALAESVNLTGNSDKDLYIQFLESMQKSFNQFAADRAILSRPDITSDTNHKVASILSDIINLEFPDEAKFRPIIRKLKGIKTKKKTVVSARTERQSEARKLIAETFKKAVKTNIRNFDKLFPKRKVTEELNYFSSTTIEEYSWLDNSLLSYYKKCLNYRQDPIALTIYTTVLVKAYNSLRKLLEDPVFSQLNLFQNRLLVKGQIMTYAYGAGNPLRIKVMKQFITEALLNNGILTPNKQAINRLVECIIRYFENWKDVNLRSAISLRQLSSIMGQAVETDIHVRTPYMHWNMHPLKSHKVAMYVRTIRGERIHRIIYQRSTPDFDGKKVAKSFGAVFIHGGDALIAHMFLDKSLEVRDKLGSMGLTLVWYLNHDSMGYNHTMQYFINYVIRACYSQFYCDKDRLIGSYKDIMAYNQSTVLGSLSLEVKNDAYHLMTKFFYSPKDANYFEGIFNNPNIMK